MKKGKRLTITLLRALTLAAAAAMATVAMVSTAVVVNSFGTRSVYYLDAADRKTENYTDSRIFSNLYGNSLEHAIRYCTIGEQMETNGALDENKEIDVASYVYRGDEPERAAASPTATYHLKDLLRWERLGFDDSFAYMTDTEAAQFFGVPEETGTQDGTEQPWDGTDATPQNGTEQPWDGTDEAPQDGTEQPQAETDGMPQETQGDTAAAVGGQLRAAQNDAGQPQTAESEVPASAGGDTGDVVRPSQDGASVAADEQESVAAGDVPRAAENDVSAAPDGTEGEFDALSAVPSYEAAAVQEAADSENEQEYHLLRSRFKTVDGRTLEQCVDNYEDYRELVSLVKQAASELTSNYEEYTQSQAYLAQSKTNFRYAVMATDTDGHVRLYTNLDVSDGFPVGDEALQEHFRSYGKYLLYAPDAMRFETNTLIGESGAARMLSSYQYAFPDNIRIYTAVDTAFPVQDEYAQAQERFLSYTPEFSQNVGIAVFFALLYAGLFIYQIVAEKRAKELTGYDHVPLELLIVLIAIYLTAIVAAGALVGSLLWGGGYLLTGGTENAVGELIAYPVFVGLLVLLSDLLLGGAFFSILRRAFSHAMWRETLLRRLVAGLRSGAWRFYDNSGTAARVWIPYLLFLLVNVVLVAVFAPLALLFDVVVGYLVYRMQRDRSTLVDEMDRIAGGDLNRQIDTRRFHGDNIRLAQAVNRIGQGIRTAVETSTKDEKLKADLITNVSHDIKTPLTSIINYVDLLKRKQIDDAAIAGYIKVLDQKSQRLKQLTDDLVEASKISSGNITLQMERLNLVELINQALGEFSEKLSARALTVVLHTELPAMYVEADSRRLWRVIENLLGNAAKYAAQGSRIYIDLFCRQNAAVVTMKNVSEQQLNISADELTERFIRGDISRSTEGSGLGLSIAKNLTQLMGGDFRIVLDGDLFKVILSFALIGKKEPQRTVVQGEDAGTTRQENAARSEDESAARQENSVQNERKSAARQASSIQSDNEKTAWQGNTAQRNDEKMAWQAKVTQREENAARYGSAAQSGDKRATRQEERRQETSAQPPHGGAPKVHFLKKAGEKLRRPLRAAERFLRRKDDFDEENPTRI